MSVSPKYITEILRTTLRPIQQWLDDANVNEIMVNPGGRVFIESSGELTDMGVRLKEDEIVIALKAIAKTVNQDAEAGKSNAMVTASIEDMRVSGALKPVCPEGSFITIRKHNEKAERPSLHDLVDNLKALTRAQADAILELVIRQRRNCLVAGATGSGKTTLINAILGQIPKHERVLVVEDAKELSIDLPNSFSIITNPQQGTYARTAVQLLLRQRPDRVILGETRGDETYDLLRALNSGHPGSLTSIHADSAEMALDAFELLFQMSLPENASLPPIVVRRYISKSIHVVVFVGRKSIVQDGVAKVQRGVEQICIVKGLTKEGNYELEYIA